MDITCLVRHGQSCRTITVSGCHMLNDVVEALETSMHFGHLNLESLILQAYDERFEDYIDMDGSTTLAQYSKLRLLNKENHPEAVEATAAVAGATAGKSLQLWDRLALEELGVEGDVSRQITSQSQFLVIQQKELPEQSARRNPERYHLPPMPLHVTTALKEVTGLGDLTEGLKRRIVDHIYHDLCTYTIYPGCLYTEAASQLVARYPVLKDGSKKKYDVWRGHLRVKAKNNRRSMASTVPGVGEARETQQKAKEAKKNNAGASVRHISRLIKGIAFWGDGEDEATVAGHLAFMAKEVRKTNPNWEQIAVSMERTFDERRHWMVAKQPLVADVISKYPALGHAQVIHQEFQLLTKHEATIELEAAVKKFGKGVITLAARKRSNKAAIDELQERLDALPEEERDGCFATSILLLLPHLLKEDAGIYLQKLDPGKVHMFPTVNYTGRGAFCADGFQVTVEDLTLDALDVLSSVSLVLSMYWAFNIKYAPGSLRSFAVIERLIGIEFTPLTPMGLTVVAQLTHVQR